MLACLWVPFFAAAATIRSEPALAERPLAIVRGALAVSRVVEANAAARERGVAPGMTEAEARSRCPALARRVFAPATVTSAQHALLEAALTVSPRVEDAGPGEIYVDTTGLRRLMGDAAAIGRRLVHQAHAVGLPARVAIAGSRTAARVIVRTMTATVMVVPASEEPATLAAAPLSQLDLPLEVETTLARWGVRTLGELASLPRAKLGARLGPPGLRAHDLALGHDRTPFRSYVPPPFWQEAQSFDWEIDDLGALLRLLGTVLERLAARLTAAQLWADGLTVHLELASGARDDRAVGLACPTREALFMLGVLRRELDAHRPVGPVTAVAVSVRPVVAHPGLSGLWQPPAPRQRDLAALTSRLVELVGDDNLGSPAPLDSHRPDAFVLKPFAPPAEASNAPARATFRALMLRRLRPPRPVQVEIEGERPVRVCWDERVSPVLASAGPWRASGDWWDTQAWAQEEWDLLLGDRTLCRLAHNRLTDHWILDGVYD